MLGTAAADMALSPPCAHPGCARSRDASASTLRRAHRSLCVSLASPRLVQLECARAICFAANGLPAAFRAPLHVASGHVQLPRLSRAIVTTLLLASNALEPSARVDALFLGLLQSLRPAFDHFATTKRNHLRSVVGHVRKVPFSTCRRHVRICRARVAAMRGRFFGQLTLPKDKREQRELEQTQPLHGMGAFPCTAR